MTDKPTVMWRKSSYSDGSGNCVEIGYFSDGTIGIRDTKARGHGPVLTFLPGEWAAFRAAVADGGFD